MDAKRCPRCATVKPLSQFHRDSRRPDGVRAECIRCRERDRLQSAAYSRALARLRELHRYEFDYIYSQEQRRNAPRQPPE